jgi:hypothetical protein
MTFPAAFGVAFRYNTSSVVEKWATVAWRIGWCDWRLNDYIFSRSIWIKENKLPIKLVRIACNLSDTWTKNSIARRELNTRTSGFKRWTIRSWRCNVMCRQCKWFYIICAEIFFRQLTMMFSLVLWQAFWASVQMAIIPYTNISKFYCVHTTAIVTYYYY